MNTTASGNIKIEINPDRHYAGQFVGSLFYRLTDVQAAFPAIKDFAALNKDGFDIGYLATNEEMIYQHCMPFRSVGYVCG